MGRLRNIGRLRAGGGSSTDADAAAWAAAVTANSGTYSAGTLSAVNTKIKALKAANLWTKVNALHGLVCGDQLAAALIQYAGGTWAPATNVNFVSGDYTEATGLTGNGSTKYLRTGLIPSVSLTLNDTHMAVYNRSSASGASGSATIGSLSGANWFSATIPFTNDVINSAQYDATNGALSSAALGAVARGHLVATRTSSSSHSIYRNGSSIASNATTGGALPAFEMYVFARNNAGVAEIFGSAPVSGYSAGSGLSAADATAYNTIEQAFQTALGRNV